jgi:hypothetical protein
MTMAASVARVPKHKITNPLVELLRRYNGRRQSPGGARKAYLDGLEAAVAADVILWALPY